MIRTVLALLFAASTVAHAQDVPDDPQRSGYARPFGEAHIQEKHREQIAIGLRVREHLRLARERDEARYAESRRRCQAALKVAELCGKHAGTFYCDDKGFKPTNPAARPAALGNSARYKMERCVLDAARLNP